MIVAPEDAIKDEIRRKFMRELEPRGMVAVETAKEVTKEAVKTSQTGGT